MVTKSVDSTLNDIISELRPGMMVQQRRSHPTKPKSEYLYTISCHIGKHFDGFGSWTEPYYLVSLTDVSDGKFWSLATRDLRSLLKIAQLDEFDWLVISKYEELPGRAEGNVS